VSPLIRYTKGYRYSGETYM